MLAGLSCDHDSYVSQYVDFVLLVHEPLRHDKIGALFQYATI